MKLLSCAACSTLWFRRVGWRNGRSHLGGGNMFRKLIVLAMAAAALGACESQSGALMTGPLSKTGTQNPDQAPGPYMVFFNLGSTKLSDQDQNTVAQAAQVFKTKPNATIAVTCYADTVGSPSLHTALSAPRGHAGEGLLR